ncbi:MAG: hypothetical protein PVS2B3_00760 [Steroidobacteraceae bacterium]
MAPGRALSAFAVGLALIASPSCGTFEARDAAEKLIERYFAARSGDDLTAVLSFYSPRFFAGTPREQWLASLQAVQDRCGKPASHALKGWTAANRGGADSGATVTMTYDVSYASCQLSETLVVFEPEGGEIQILRHVMKLREPPPDQRPAGTST